MKKAITKLSALVMAFSLLGTSTNALIANAKSCTKNNHYARPYAYYTEWARGSDITEPGVFGPVVVGHVEFRFKIYKCTQCNGWIKAKYEEKNVYTKFSISKILYG